MEQHDQIRSGSERGVAGGTGMPAPVVRRIAPATARDVPALMPGSPGFAVSDVPTRLDGLTVPQLAGWLTLSPSERAIVDSALPELTRREREVLYEICTGGTNEAVAERIGVKLPTLRTHLMRLNQKLGSTSKSDLVRLVMQVLLVSYRGAVSPAPASTGV